MSWKAKSKGNGGSKYTKDPEEERAFDELRRKYAYAIAYLLINNIKQSELREYLNREDNAKRYESLKRFRQDILDKRPRAKQWVDKPFYIGLKVGECEASLEGWFQTQLIVNDFLFKQQTRVVTSAAELTQYMDTIAKIIDSEKIWSDPAMADFDMGERDDTCVAVAKKKPQQTKKADADEEEKGDQLMLESGNENSVDLDRAASVANPANFDMSAKSRVTRSGRVPTPFPSS